MLVLLEFQPTDSTDDPDMALRMLEYTTLLYQELARNRALESDGRRPPRCCPWCSTTVKRRGGRRATWAS